MGGSQYFLTVIILVYGKRLLQAYRCDGEMLLQYGMHVLEELGGRVHSFPFADLY